MFHIQQDLDNLVSWCHKWRLSLNTTKCAVVRFSFSSKSKACYYIEENLVPTADSHKDLGILVTADLSWSKHIKLLPLMYWLELQDVLFLVKCLQGTTARTISTSTTLSQLPQVLTALQEHPSLENLNTNFVAL